MKNPLFIFPLLLIFFLAACHHDPTSGTTYTRSETLETQHVSKGVVVDIQPVRIEKDVTGAGAVIGGAIGGVAAGDTDGSNSKRILQIVAATAGAFIGEFIEGKTTLKQGLEIVVDLEDGDSVSIVQEQTDDQHFSVGDTVRLVDNGRRVRVVIVKNS